MRFLYIWTIAFGNKETYQNASQQLIDMMERDKNRCAVVVWSLANETPESEDRNTFLANLSKQAKQMDNTRLISMAIGSRRYSRQRDEHSGWHEQIRGHY